MADDDGSGPDNSEKGKNISSPKSARLARFGLQTIGGAIPGLGGLLSAAAGAWSEQEQEHVNRIFKQWLQMLEDELQEKSRTIIEIMARIDMNDEKTRERIESPAYQSLLKKAFRNWQNVDSESKRQKVRNLLSNAAASSLVTDDVVRLFLDWIDDYSDFHFTVIGQVYRNAPITRARIWDEVGRGRVREDSAEADLFKLLVHDLSIGRVIRQHRDTDGYGNYLKKQTSRTSRSTPASATVKSAFDDTELYVLTELGKQFVHYAMNELAPRITFDSSK